MSIFSEILDSESSEASKESLSTYSYRPIYIIALADHNSKFYDWY